MTDFFNNYNIFRTRYEVSGSREYKVGDKHFGQYFGVLFKQRIVSEIRRVPSVVKHFFGICESLSICGVKQSIVIQHS